MAIFDQHLLTAIVFLPLVAAMLAASFPRANNSGVRGFAITVSVIDFLLALVMWAKFDTTSGAMQLVEKVEWIPSLGISYGMGVDGLSVLLIVLTTFLAPLVILSTYSGVEERIREYVVCVLFLQAGMLGSFVATDLFLFYVFYEVMLVPMYFLIGMWGGRRRIYAALKFFLYTMAGSVLMLVAILFTVYAVKDAGGLTFDYATLIERLTAKDLGGAEVWLFLAFAVAFAIKVPMFPFHTWLPDAHVEAPTGGSVILAGVLLKVGTYGFLRFAMMLFPKAAMIFLPTIGVLAVIGIVYGALVAMVQDDLKRLVAYSSVSHLGFVMLGLAAMTVTGVAGGVLQMVNHGISTGALFLLVGVIYERRHTRLLADFGGLAKVMPVYAFFWVFITLSSIGVPGLNGFVGEFLIIMGTFQSEGIVLPATGATLAQGLVTAAGLLGAAMVVLMGLAMLRRKQGDTLGVGTRVAAVVVAALLAALLFAPPVGAFSGGLLVRPLAGALTSTEDFKELFAALAVVASTGVIFAAVYLLLATQKVFFGPIRHTENQHLHDLTFREKAMLVPFAVVALVTGLYPQPLLNAVTPTVQAVATDFRKRAELPELGATTAAVPSKGGLPRLQRVVGPANPPPNTPSPSDPRTLQWRRILQQNQAPTQLPPRRVVEPAPAPPGETR